MDLSGDFPSYIYYSESERKMNGKAIKDTVLMFETCIPNAFACVYIFPITSVSKVVLELKWTT